MMEQLYLFHEALSGTSDQIQKQFIFFYHYRIKYNKIFIKFKETIFEVIFLPII